LNFFVYPCRLRERKLNKSINELIHRHLTKQAIKDIMEKPNDHPEKYLVFKTSGQLFFEINPTVAPAI